MAWHRYTPEQLATTVAASYCMAEVMRRLGLRLTGGGHAHLRRRITALGIDTSHFTGRRGSPGAPARTPEQILVERDPARGRADPATLRRALRAIGRAYRCTACGVGERWNDQPLTLHIDHVDGRFEDCRPANLRFLCPNCHTQTGTFAGRKRRTEAGGPVHLGDPVGLGLTRPRSEDDWAALLARIDRGEVTVAAAARLLGCGREQIYRARRRLKTVEVAR